MNKICELFCCSTGNDDTNWSNVIENQICSYVNKKCYKVRKSTPGISIGTCTVLYGKNPEPIIICPNRLIEGGQIFIDCFHLLTMHEPGNELHIVPEVSIPGGSVDYFLVSVREGKVADFVGIELQTLDTTGTVWPERQRLLKRLGIQRQDSSEDENKPYGMNWKMTAKTILVQMHHKISTFEHINKKLVLVVQDKLLHYMSREFQFSHMKNPPLLGDSMHLHAYKLNNNESTYKLQLASRLSTDSEGISICLGLQAEAKVELEQIIAILQSKISPYTKFNM